MKMTGRLFDNRRLLGRGTGAYFAGNLETTALESIVGLTCIQSHRTRWYGSIQRPNL